MNTIERQILLDIGWAGLYSNRIDRKLRHLSARVRQCKPENEACARLSANSLRTALKIVARELRTLESSVSE
jgi:hypothetical protein